MRARPKVTQPRFVLGASRPAQFPRWDLAEVAFGGRSNVGKSSLLRVLLGSRRLVRVSRRPGHTQQVNFFQLRLDGAPCAFVDLPGYGYARAPGSVQALWAHTVEHYVTERANLALLVLLVDARRGPREEELAVHEVLAARGLSALTVYTKIDQVPKNRRGNVLAAHQRALGSRGRPLAFSALTGEGQEALLAKLAAALRARGRTKAGATESEAPASQVSDGGKSPDPSVS